MSCLQVVLIGQTLLCEASHVSDQNISARRDEQLCQLNCEPARERWSQDGLSDMKVHSLPHLDSSDSSSKVTRLWQQKHSCGLQLSYVTAPPAAAVCEFQRLALWLIQGCGSSVCSPCPFPAFAPFPPLYTLVQTDPLQQSPRLISSSSYSVSDNTK